MAIIQLADLISAGVHYGTKTSLWHPRMKPFIFAQRNNVYIIDLKETVRALIETHYFIKKLASKNKTVLFVGTKRQARDIVHDTAVSLGMPYVVERWLGGTLTNNNTIRSSIRRLEDIESEIAMPDYSRQSKKIQARHARERRRILRNLAGVRNMTKLPDVLVVIDPIKEQTAIAEARRLDIPVIALVDTDCDPSQVNLPIPGNDDGIRSIQVILNVVAAAYQAGKAEQVTKMKDDEKKAETAKKEDKVKGGDKKPVKKFDDKKVEGGQAKDAKKKVKANAEA
ncbi:MAG: 30S ribosomal protein S2 [Planctomycetes bacterium]|nr:30S ribosomal protein S2 [Planctomycetota bacterium]